MESMNSPRFTSSVGTSGDRFEYRAAPKTTPLPTSRTTATTITLRRIHSCFIRASVFPKIVVPGVVVPTVVIANHPPRRRTRQRLHRPRQKGRASAWRRYRQSRKLRRRYAAWTRSRRSFRWEPSLPACPETPTADKHRDALSQSGHTPNPKVLLVDRSLHLHSGRIDHLHERHARTHLIAFLHFSHLSLLPDRVQNHHAVDRRVNLHELGIRLRVQHGFARAIALNFQNANRCLGRLPF